MGGLLGCIIIMVHTPIERTKDKNNDFYWTWRDQPHRWRRKEILKKYPEIKDLYGYDPMTKWAVSAMVLGQTWACWWLMDKSWTTFLITAYCFPFITSASTVYQPQGVWKV